MPKHPRNDTDGGGVPIFRNDHSDDIVEDLRFIALIHEGRHRHGCITEAADEIERLRRWKAEATEILARWDAVADTIEIGPNLLGLHKSDLVAIELNDLRAQRDGYFASSHEWRDEYKNLHTLVRKWADNAEGAIYNSYEEAVAELRNAVGR